MATIRAPSNDTVVFLGRPATLKLQVDPLFSDPTSSDPASSASAASSASSTDAPPGGTAPPETFSEAVPHDDG
eukprot:1181194-Prorocentrum_minimum.AAC.1